MPVNASPPDSHQTFLSEEIFFFFCILSCFSVGTASRPTFHPSFSLCVPWPLKSSLTWNELWRRHLSCGQVIVSPRVMLEEDQREERQEKCSQENSHPFAPEPKCLGELDRVSVISDLVRNTHDSHAITCCASVFPRASFYQVGSGRGRAALMGMSTSDSQFPQGDGFANCWFLLAIVHPISQFLWGRESERWLQLALTEMGRGERASRKIAHKCCFRCCHGITVERSSAASRREKRRTK